MASKKSPKKMVIRRSVIGLFDFKRKRPLAKKGNAKKTYRKRRVLYRVKRCTAQKKRSDNKNYKRIQLLAPRFILSDKDFDMNVPAPIKRF